MEKTIQHHQAIMSSNFLSSPRDSLQALLDSRRQAQEDEMLVKEHIRSNMGKAMEEAQESLQKIYDKISQVLSSDEFIQARSLAIESGLDKEFAAKMGDDIGRELRKVRPSSVTIVEGFDFSMEVLRRMAHDLMATPLSRPPHSSTDAEKHYQYAWERSKQLGSIASSWEVNDGLNKTTLEFDIRLLKSLVGIQGEEWLDEAMMTAVDQSRMAHSKGRRSEFEVFTSLENALSDSRDILLYLQDQSRVPVIHVAMNVLRKKGRASAADPEQAHPGSASAAEPQADTSAKSRSPVPR